MILSKFKYSIYFIPNFFRLPSIFQGLKSKEECLIITYSTACTRVYSFIKDTLPPHTLIDQTNIRPYKRNFGFALGFILGHKNKTLITILNHSPNSHFPGWFLTHLANIKGFNTITPQHGGNKKDSQEQLASSPSKELWLWNKQSYNLIENLIPNKKVKIIGNPSAKRLYLSQPKYILIATCMHTEYTSEIEYNEFTNILKNITEKLNHIQFIIKPHPNDKVESYNKLLSKNVTVSNKDFYDLLSEASHLITRQSTTAEEALALGIPVLFIQIPSKIASHPYPEFENSILIDNAPEGIKFIESHNRLK